MRRTKHAVALHDWHDGPTEVSKGEVIRSMPADQFDGFEDAGMVREATAAELARADGKPEAERKAPAPRKPRQAPKAAEPKVPPAPPAPPSDSNPKD